MSAYNRRNYNPDALPAHAEPEQAAQMLSKDNYANKPAPAPPVQNLRTDDRYGRAPSPQGYKSPTRTNTGGAGWDNYDRRQQQAPPPQPPPAPSSNQRYNDYESQPQRPRQDSYGQRPQGYEGGYGQGRPQAGRPPPTPAPRNANERDGLWPMFMAVDKDRSGQLDEKELGAALINGDYTSFDPHTVRMMIRMFDVDRSGTVSFDEFCGLWGFLSEWRKLFDRFDVDRSGNISFDEFSSALVAFGYRLSQDYVSLLFNTYDSRGRGVLSFDLFVQSCISLKRMTDIFKKYDTDRDGYITLSFEEFLTEALAQR